MGANLMAAFACLRCSTALKRAEAPPGRAAIVPDLAGGADDELEFAPLRVFADGVAENRAGATALGAEAQIFERHEPRSLLDSVDQLPHRFELSALGGDEAEDDRLVARREAQRREASGAFVIVAVGDRDFRKDFSDQDVGGRG
jgi:hypothetical protein